MYWNTLLTLWILILRSDIVLLQDIESGLFPVVFNLASRADITSNATCGEYAPEQFCKLVQHVKNVKDGSYLKEHCGVCDPRSSDPRDHHPIQNAIDGTESWWQSPSIANGRIYHHVTVTIDLKQVYQVAYVILKAANSPRPGNWILESSLDGVDYKPWQYFAVSDSECWNSYGIPPTVGVPNYKKDDEVICTSYYSRLDPLQNGEIHVSLVNGRPGVDGPSDTLLDFTTTKYVRFRFQRIRTLNADLMTFIYNDPKDLDATVSNRYFYSIKDISIGGQCICYGHAKHCPIDPDTGELKCKCEGNTCGNSCEECCPLFNQQPWKKGTYEESAMCQECECFGHADACVYNETIAQQGLSLNVYGDYDGGGVCIDCKHNTMGVNCELCADGFFRPAGRSHREPDVCIPCDCDSVGSTGLCIKDDSLALDGIYAGDCICLEGYCGPRCDECSPGYRGFPNCEPCPCDRAGSINPDTCEDECICKPNVRGDHCDVCSGGFYNLQDSNPGGCDPCFCFGISQTCTSSTWGRDTLSSLEQWVLTDLAGTGTVEPVMEPDGSLSVTSQQISRINRAAYWQAPDKFIGNKILSYGGIMEYVFVYSINYTALEFGDEEPYLANYDIILEGGGMRLGHRGDYFSEEMENVVFVNMTELHWVHVEGSTSPEGTLVPREEFLQLLARVDRMLLRAAYHMYQTQTRLLGVGQEVASEFAPGPPMSSVEMCTCPPGYGGSSCESCALGFRRVGNILLEGTCEPCQCNGHAETCDPFTGECLGCQHNTRGAFCEECAFGYYGDASLGTPDSCVPCGCPLELESNNFAQGCVMTPGEETEYICIGCQVGYQGTFCELCADGYFGNPLVPGNKCLPCDCHGNTDPSLPVACDRFTGECQGCLDNTEGFNCESCISGFYGSAEYGDCQACDCDNFGSYAGDICDARTGQCECKDRYTGRDCGRCQEGYGNTALGCVACNCSSVGADSMVCDPVTGQCPCKPGVGSSTCTQCQPGFYDFTEVGCQACGCDTSGSKGVNCDSYTGQCSCKDNVIGRTCNECEEDFWGHSSGEGCSPCACDGTGSESTQCDLQSGQCRCKPGVGGRTCDRCDFGHYGFSSSGCKKCRECPLPGQVCDAETGECVCPPNTEGEYCERCLPNTWGYDEREGCKPCDCNSLGAIHKQCDTITGQCECRETYIGLQCDQCPPTMFGFPFCAPCGCSVEGTLSHLCNYKDEEQDCQCDGLGDCSCKTNVEGSKCDRCKSGTFSLDRNNPDGCTDCFCFGHARSTDCEQAAYVWSKKTVPDKTISINIGDFTDVTKNSFGEFLIAPEDAGTVTVAAGDADLGVMYSLPRSALGDKTLSYNGRLRFSVEREYVDGPAGIMEDMGPVAHIWGNFHYQLFHYGKPTMYGNTFTYDIPLHESVWQDQSRQNISRETMMVALQNLQYWTIKVADTSWDTKSAKVFGINYDVAVEAVDTEPNAFGIEVCDCLPEWNGLSCQNPASGYYRIRPIVEVVDPPDMIGESTPCKCNDHSTTCDPETGFCKDCEDNTSGDFCQLCAPGYYGNATYGLCRPCACPLLSSTNNFSPTCISVGYDYMCDACPFGYIGNMCEGCAEGYFGRPGEPGGSCEPCGCDVSGSLSSDCSPVTGQCQCREGIMGRTCDHCKPRHAIVEGSCVSCDEGCTGILMESVDEFQLTLDGFNSSASALLPWARLGKIENSMENFRGVIRASNVVEYAEIRDEIENLRSSAKRASFRASDVKRITDSETLELEELGDAARSLPVTIKQSRRDLTEITQQLKIIAKEQNAAGGLRNLSASLAQAEDILRQLKEVSFETGTEVVEEEDVVGETLLEEVEKLAEDANVDIEPVKEKVLNIRDRLQEIIDTAGVTKIQTEDISSKNDVHRDVLQQIKDLIADAKRAKKDIDATHTMAENNTNTAAHLLWNVSSTNYQKSQDMLRELRMKKEDVKMKTGLIDDGLPGVVELVQKAKQHADDLERQAESLEGLFTDTKVAAEAPLKAAGVYENIVDAIQEADNATDAASAAAVSTFGKIIDSAGGPMDDQVRRSLSSSKDLHDEAVILEDKTTGMKPRMEKVKDGLTITEDAEYETEETLDDTMAQLEKLDPDLTGNLGDVSYTALATQGKSEVMGKRAQEILEESENEFQPKVDEMRSAKIEGIRKANASVNAAKGEFTRLYNLTTMLDNKRQRVDQLGTDIGNSLRELKEKIRLAREQAKSIKVSLYHESNCARQYQPDNKDPTVTNNIVLHFKTNHTSHDQLLFLLRNPDRSDYLALELRGQKVRFSWDVGAGNSFVESNVLVESYDGKTDEDEMWYRVEAQRYGGLGRLNVRKVSSKDTITFVEFQGPLTHSRLDVDEMTEIYVGGVMRSVDLPEDVISTGYAGCIGEVSLDFKPIGLYNFVDREGRGCNGCMMVPGTSDTSGQYQFDGTGFASMPQVRYIENQYTIILEFKSYWKDALLFFAHNPATDEFISLELVDGHVVYTFGFENGERATMETIYAYNTNEWIRVNARRLGNKGRLDVNLESQEGSAGIRGDGKLDLKDVQINFGGIPSVLDIERFGVTSTSFLGCMQNIQISSRGTYLQNLLDGFYAGMTVGCKSDQAPVVGLPGDGHVELPSDDLPKDGGFSFSFRTLQADGLLILARGTKPTNFYSVSLSGGRLSSWFNAGSGMVRMTSRKTYNDGRLHTVSIVKTNRLIEMYIDDVRSGSGRLATGSRRINSMLGERGGLYIGGVPDDVDATGRAASLQSLEGCIMDLLFNGRLLTMDNPVTFEDADIGRCNVQEMFPNITGGAGDGDGEEGGGPEGGGDLEETTTEKVISFTVTVTLPPTTTPAPTPPTTLPGPLVLPTQCASLGPLDEIKEAVAFGDVKHSHAEIIVKRRAINKDFNMTMEFRTYYKKGLLFYITNEAQTEYVAVVLDGGRVIVSYDDRGEEKYITGEGNVGDGYWHKVFVKKDRKSITLRVDNYRPHTDTITRRVDVIAPIYVGGLPMVFQPRAGLMSESFKGCMRSFLLNGRDVDLANSKAIMGVRQCFTHVEPGVHFDGFGYAIESERFSIRSEFKATFEFRTTMMDGIILSTSHIVGYPALAIELFEGKLLLTAVDRDGSRFTAQAPGLCEHCLCDNNWHTVTAQYIRNVVTLQLDGGSNRVGISPGNTEALNLNYEMYIGGFPTFALPQGATTGNTFFEGCVRNFKLNDELVDWHKSYSLIDVHVSACPVSIYPTKP